MSDSNVQVPSGANVAQAFPVAPALPAAGTGVAYLSGLRVDNLDPDTIIRHIDDPNGPGVTLSSLTGSASTQGAAVADAVQAATTLTLDQVPAAINATVATLNALLASLRNAKVIAS